MKTAKQGSLWFLHCTVQEGLSMVYVTNDDVENVEKSKYVLVLKTFIPNCEDEDLFVCFFVFLTRTCLNCCYTFSTAI